MKIIARIVSAFGLTDIDEEDNEHVPFCACGHFEFEHMAARRLSLRFRCHGAIGPDSYGYRESKRSKEMRHDEG